MNRNFKQILQITSVFLAFVKFSIASDSTFDSPYLSKNILGKVQNISIDKLLDYKHIALTIENPFDIIFSGSKAFNNKLLWLRCNLFSLIFICGFDLFSWFIFAITEKLANT